jgi:hypothetical protein
MPTSAFALNQVRHYSTCQFVSVSLPDHIRFSRWILEEYHPSVRVLHSDLTETNDGIHDWAEEFAGCETLVITSAQIGGIVRTEFVRNNIVTTERS